MKISQATPPPIPDKISYPFYDEPWWLDYSRWVRASKGWQCDECGISLENNHELADLQALCIGCHAEQPGGNHKKIKETRTYKRFMDRFGEQWRAYRAQMGFER